MMSLLRPGLKNTQWAARKLQLSGSGSLPTEHGTHCQTVRRGLFHITSSSSCGSMRITQMNIDRGISSCSAVHPPSQLLTSSSSSSHFSCSALRSFSQLTGSRSCCSAWRFSQPTAGSSVNTFLQQNNSCFHPRALVSRSMTTGHGREQFSYMAQSLYKASSKGWDIATKYCYDLLENHFLHRDGT
jgi:hypothetical protein